MAIPKIIHVCWFGRATPSRMITRCLRTVEQLQRHGYQVRIWTEDNYDLEKSPRLIEASRNRRWSLVSNYARLDLLNDFGGVYLDADVEVSRDFDDLLGHAFFIGYIWDCTLGTAVIGAEPGHPVVQDLLKQYDDDPHTLRSPNNNTVTDFFLRNIPGFKLDGKPMSIAGVRVLDKYAFEHPRLLTKGYTIHHLAQSWKTGSRTKYMLRTAITKVFPLWLYRRYVCWRSLKISPYYAEYLRQSS